MKKLLAILIIPAALVAGCGGSDDSSGGDTATLSPAAQLFDSAGCGGCHTLSEANANGPVGPNLDGMNLDVARVRDQIENGSGSMPPFKDDLSQKQIDQLAEFVSKASQS